jgi:DNA recombination-dependent growth factor C
MSRYRVSGKIDGPLMETIHQGLSRHTVPEIDGESTEKATGWTSWQNPYQPDFEGSSFVYGTYLVFSLRVDKKSIPAKAVQKLMAVEMSRKLADENRPYISKNEKKLIKEQVTDTLCRQVPSVPNIYDLIWNYEEGRLFFFTTLKSANEELEDLFVKTFGLNLIRLFPYTLTEVGMELTADRKERLNHLKPTTF